MQAHVLEETKVMFSWHIGCAVKVNILAAKLLFSGRVSEMNIKPQQALLERQKCEHLNLSLHPSTPKAYCVFIRIAHTQQMCRAIMTSLSAGGHKTEKPSALEEVLHNGCEALGGLLLG